MPILTGDNIILRPYRRSDLPHILSWTNDPDTVRNLTDRFAYPYTEVNGESYLNMRLAGNPSEPAFVIARKGTEEYIGQIDLCLSGLDRSGELGIVIGSPEDRYKGYGKEAIGLLLHYAFRTLGLHRVSLSVLSSNEAARRCYLSAGFVIEGIRREMFFKDGEFQDVTVMGVLRREWEEAREKRYD